MYNLLYTAQHLSSVFFFFFIKFEIHCFSGSSAASESFQKNTCLTIQRYIRMALKTEYIDANHTESWSNTIPCARWAKFDTREPINNWLNVIDKSVEHRFAVSATGTEPKPPPSNLYRGQEKEPVPRCSVAEASRFIAAWDMCLHIHMHHPCVYSWVYISIQRRKKKFSQERRQELQKKN